MFTGQGDFQGLGIGGLAAGCTRHFLDDVADGRFDGFPNLGIDWQAHIAGVNQKIAADGYSLFGLLVMMMLFKGVLVSAAGPAPNYDMQKILATKTPREGALMSGFVSLVLSPARYLMIAGFVVLGLAAGTQASTQGAILQMVNHGLTTGALFLLVGVIYERRHTREIADFGGLTHVMPVYATFTLGGLDTLPTGEVLTTDGDPIPGLYAAGRTCCGLPRSGEGGHTTRGNGHSRHG